MAKQSIQQRVNRVINDRNKEKFDPKDRWEKIREGLPHEVAEIEKCLGPMPSATLDDIPLDKAVYYACRDADGTYRVNAVLDGMLDDLGLRPVYEMDLSIVPMVERMCSVGMAIDIRHFNQLSVYLTDLMSIQVGNLNVATRGLSGPNFNPNSGDQCAELLFGPGGLGIPGFKLTESKRRLSTNDKVLESLAFKHPACRIICDYRELAKLRDSFCVTLPKTVGDDGRVHPNLQLTRVSSGRLSCKEPNLLAIPVRTELAKLIREGFVAGPGRVLGDWDLDQIEMREMAHQSSDPVMCKIFNEGKEDIHRKTGAMMFGCKVDDVTGTQRYAAKRVGFGIITGITEKGLAEQMALAGASDWDEQRCSQAIREYLNVYRGVRSFMDDCRAEARRYGYVRDRWGRRRYLPGVHSELSWVRDEALRQSHSFKISASAQGTLKHAMSAIWQWMRPQLGDIEPLLQVHDELLFEMVDDEKFTAEAGEAIVWFLCNSAPMKVPIKAKGSTGPNWGVLKD